MATLTERLFDASVAIESIIWLPGIQEIQPDDFENFCDQDETAAVLEWLPELLPLFSAEDLLEPDQFLQALRSRSGFLFEAATPVRTCRLGAGQMYSWGHRWTAWLYATTPAEMADRAIAWAERKCALATEKSRARGEPATDRET